MAVNEMSRTYILPEIKILQMRHRG